jgi:murein DD-endopeptidase MepM/ murein hydrolase activator NlpD
MRVVALLAGLWLALPALGAARADSACNGMLMPPEQLREISRGFGHGHTGIDLMAPLGSPIRAAAGGTVLYAGWYYDYGNIVDIRHADGLITRYGHM